MAKTLVATPKEHWIHHSTPMPNGYFNERTFIDDVREMEFREPVSSYQVGDYVLYPRVIGSNCEWFVVKIFWIWPNGDIQHTDARYPAIPARYFYRATDEDISAKLAADAEMKRSVMEMIAAGERQMQLLSESQEAADRDFGYP